MRVRLKDPKAIIRDPRTMLQLPADGGDVPDSVFWRRRIADGDVEELDEDGEPVKPPAEDRPAPTGREPVASLTTRRRPMPLPGVPDDEGGSR